MTLDSGLLFWGHPVYTISEKNVPVLFFNKTVKRWPIFFGMQSQRNLT